MQRTGNRHAALVAFSFFAAWGLAPHAWAAEPLVIAASPSLKAPIEALARAFEVRRPDVRVNVWYDTGLDLRRTIAAMENHPTGKYFMGRGPIHLVAPGGDELLTRLAHKYYVLPGTRRAYAAVPLVLVVPEQLVEAPTSFEELGKGATYRIAIADPALTELGRQTRQMLDAMGLTEAVKGRLDVASDARGVLDHLLYGQADVGLLFGPDAVRERQRIRVVAVAGPPAMEPTVHAMAMERSCPDRALCSEFLAFIQSPEAQAIVRSLGYLSPASR